MGSLSTKVHRKIGQDASALSNTLIAPDMTRPLWVKSISAASILLVLVAVDIALVSNVWSTVFVGTGWRAAILSAQALMVILVLHLLTHNWTENTWDVINRIGVTFTFIFLLMFGVLSAYLINAYGIEPLLEEANNTASTNIQSFGWSIDVPEEADEALVTELDPQLEQISILTDIRPYIPVAIFVAMMLAIPIIAIGALNAIKILVDSVNGLVARYGKSKALVVPSKRMLNTVSRVDEIDNELKELSANMTYEQYTNIIYNQYSEGLARVELLINRIKLNSNNEKAAREEARALGFGDSFIARHLMDIDLELLESLLNAAKATADYSRIEVVVKSELS